MHTAVRTAIRIPHEPGFAHRAVQRQERWDFVLPAVLAGELDLRIDRGAAASDLRLTMAACTAVEIHSWPESIRNVFGFFEVLLPDIEVRELRRR
jgi:hypothetical protein